MLRLNDIAISRARVRNGAQHQAFVNELLLTLIAEEIYMVGNFLLQDNFVDWFFKIL